MFTMASYLNSAKTLALLIALVAEVLLYGIYVPLFFVCLWVMVSRNDPPKWKLIAPLTMMFILSTIHTAVVLYLFIESFIQSPSPKEHFLDQQYPLVVLTYALYDALNFIGDGIVLTGTQIYRTYIICDSGFRVVALPIMLHLASTSMGAYSTASLALGKNSFSPATEKLSLAGYSLSLVLNVACTALITHRIWTSTRMISPLIGSQRAAKCYAVLQIIIESAAIYTVAMAVLISTYASRAPDAAQVSFQINVQIVCIVPTLILVRAGLRQKTSDEWEATRPQKDTAHVLDWPEDRRSSSVAKNDNDDGCSARV
ncbi:hypothetical protein BOTBODRAFT_181632 [Botryobasidium botryosum FD-172 SS1]|uniref:Integral membrane protein n=1 Tax=Botryobasidium botryosum (strain FD-172 SS1) TaxID=930990 RepID=A0A067LT03_BOTB1|nr:hypothetical protein BOTBODRAFT_181632 [Botryobasidium botryosum FD-172 SS1]